MKIQQALCGSWLSPINSRMVVSNAVSLDEIQLNADRLFYLERRPDEQGRCVIVASTNGQTADIIPAPYSARSRVHEYGGGVYCIGDNSVYFVNDNDQDIYRVESQTMQRITQSPHLRFADLTYDAIHQQLIAVCEQHIIPDKQAEPGSEQHDETKNFIASICINSGKISILCQGYDFYSNPRLSPDGVKLCWLCWHHPDMPWDNTELWLADIDNTGQIKNPRQIAGHFTSTDNTVHNISICQPRWSTDNHLYFISDENNWWQIYRYEKHINNTLISIENNDIGQPQWVFAQSDYAFLSPTQILTHYTVNKYHYLVIINTQKPQQTTTIHAHIDTQANEQWQSFSSIQTNKQQIALIGASPTQFPAVISTARSEVSQLDNHASIDFHTIAVSSTLPVTADYLSQALPVQFNNRHQQTVYANYYPPTNPQFAATDNEKPPLIIICHGGPTACAGTSLDPKKQFWTSRGFALLDVNYSGSSGFGRTYRQRLHSQWGLLDVEDCCDAAQFMVAQGLADRQRLIIRGSSAGGYTVLCALTFHQDFSAGASYYGIAELESLASDTHKFESHYLDSLIGSYPDKKLIYQQRSPLYHSEQLNCPVIFFQGMEDNVVPKEQAEKMIDALDKKGIAVASHFFAGEQHGFRKAETITTTLDNELYFYAQIFGFEIADGTPIKIRHQKRHKKTK